MLCSSIRRRASFIAAAASCTLGLSASASRRAIRRSTTAIGPAASPPAAGVPAALASKPCASQTRRNAGPCAVSSWMRSTSSTYWCAISCFSTSRTTPQGCVTTSRREIAMVRCARIHSPRRRS